MTVRERKKRNREIAWLYRSGQLSQPQLARRYNMTQANVQIIIAKFNSTDVTDCDPNGSDDGDPMLPCRRSRSKLPVCQHGRDCYNSPKCAAAVDSFVDRSPHASGCEI